VPVFAGAPEEIRTPDPQIRRLRPSADFVDKFCKPNPISITGHQQVSTPFANRRTSGFQAGPVMMTNDSVDQTGAPTSFQLMPTATARAMRGVPEPIDTQRISPLVALSGHIPVIAASEIILVAARTPPVKQRQLQRNGVA
jgi:hypothetical protein